MLCRVASNRTETSDSWFRSFIVVLPVHCLIGILDFLQVFRSSLDGGLSPGLILKEIDDCLQAFPFLEVIDFADTSISANRSSIGHPRVDRPSAVQSFKFIANQLNEYLLLLVAIWSTKRTQPILQTRRLLFVRAISPEPKIFRKEISAAASSLTPILSCAPIV